MDKLDKLIHILDENQKIPKDKHEKEYLLRALMNTWTLKPLPEEFFILQDEYLKEKLSEKVIVSVEDLREVQKNIYLWQGDICCLKVDAIVNAANNRMLGCFIPHHKCIDNAIHSSAGLQLRLACNEIMNRQGHLEETGSAKIIPAFNLPSKYVLHTVGPIIYDCVRKEDEDALSSCYLSCLNLALEHKLKSIAFCCISTGEFRFPNELAANIATKTVKDFLKKNNNVKVIFNVFKDEDKKIYENILNS